METSKPKVQSLNMNLSKALLTSMKYIYTSRNAKDIPFSVVDLACGSCHNFPSVLNDFHDQKRGNEPTYYYGVEVDNGMLHGPAVENVRPMLPLDLLGHPHRAASLHATLLHGDLWTPDARIVQPHVLFVLNCFYELYCQEQQQQRNLAQCLLSSWAPHLMLVNLDEPEEDFCGDFGLWKEHFFMWCCKSALKYGYESHMVAYQDSPTSNRKRHLAVFTRSKQWRSSVPRDLSGESYRTIYQVVYPGCQELRQDQPLEWHALRRLERLAVEPDSAATWNTSDLMLQEIALRKTSNEQESIVRSAPLVRRLVERDDPVWRFCGLELDLSTPHIRTYLETCAMWRKYLLLYADHPLRTVPAQTANPKLPSGKVASTVHDTAREFRDVCERRLLQRLEQMWRNKAQEEMNQYMATNHPTWGLSDTNNNPKEDKNAAPEEENTGQQEAPVAPTEREENKENVQPSAVSEGGDSAVYKVKPQSPSEVETNLETLQKRQRSIDVVKEGEHYIHYLCAVPKEQRDSSEPCTPNKFVKISRRNWDARIRSWRIRIHSWCREKPSLKLSPMAQLAEMDP